MTEPRRKHQRRRRVAIQILVDPATRNELKTHLAAQERTIQELLGEYVEKFLQCCRRRKPPG